MNEKNIFKAFDDVVLPADKKQIMLENIKNSRKTSFKKNERIKKNEKNNIYLYVKYVAAVVAVFVLFIGAKSFYDIHKKTADLYNGNELSGEYEYGITIAENSDNKNNQNEKIHTADIIEGEFEKKSEKEQKNLSEEKNVISEIKKEVSEKNKTQPTSVPAVSEITEEKTEEKTEENLQKSELADSSAQIEELKKNEENKNMPAFLPEENETVFDTFEEQRATSGGGSSGGGGGGSAATMKKKSVEAIYENEKFGKYLPEKILSGYVFSDSEINGDCLTAHYENGIYSLVITINILTENLSYDKIISEKETPNGMLYEIPFENAVISYFLSDKNCEKEKITEMIFSAEAFMKK